MRRQPPSVGRTVHYVSYGTPGGEYPAGICRAAIITEVGMDVPGGVNVAEPEGFLSTIGIAVLNPEGIIFKRAVPFDEQKSPGSWHWPERVEE